MEQMTGAKAKEIRKNYGFTQEELAEILGYAQKQNIHKIEKMEVVPNMYSSALRRLMIICDAIRIYLKSFFKDNEISEQDYQIVYDNQRVVKVYVRRIFVKDLSIFIAAFPVKKFVFDKSTGFSSIEFEYKNLK